MMSGQFFFFKHKTAYDMRISDWSSDVGSSDLPIRLVSPAVLAREKDDWVLRQVRVEFAGGTADLSGRWGQARMVDAKLNDIRSEVRRVGKECVSTCSSRWSPNHKKKKKRIYTTIT